MNAAGANLINIRNTRQHHVDTRGLGKRLTNERGEVVFAAQNQQREKVVGGTHAPNNLGLSAGDILATSQDSNMGGADLGHDGKVGIGGPRKALDLVKMVHTHLENQHLGVGRSGQNRERHTDQIVEITLGGPNAIALGKHCRKDILGRRLTDRAGNANHEAAKLRAIGMCQAQQKFLGIIGV